GVEAVRTALPRGGPDALVHLHVDDVDHAGHAHGIDSEQWRTALAEVDALIGALLRRVPRGTRVHLTADHGMVDTSAAHTVDLGEEPAILSLVEEVTGEARALALHAVPGDGAAEELAERMRVLMGSAPWSSPGSRCSPRGCSVRPPRRSPSTSGDGSPTCSSSPADAGAWTTSHAAPRRPGR